MVNGSIVTDPPAGKPRSARAALSRNPVVLCVRPNPEPQESARDLHHKCAMVQSDSRGPQLIQFLELQLRMPRVVFEELERLVRRSLNPEWETPVAHPEGRGGAMVHKFVERPARSSASA